MHQEQYIEVNNTSIRYQDSAGEGDVVLLTHGIGSSLEIWAEQMKGMSANYRVIVWDIPGHGLSGFGKQPYEIADFAQFAWEFLDKLKIQRVNLVGNSMGGAISIQMYGLQPTRVKKIALLNSANLGREVPLPFQLMALPFLGRFMAQPNQMAIDQQINAIFLKPAAVSAELKAVIKRNVLREGAQQAFLNTLKKMTTVRGQKASLVKKAKDILLSTEIPILFIHGRQDKVIPCAHSQEVQKITPNSKLEIIENCGHTPQIEKPDKIQTILNDFFANNLGS
jgi:2-hydroxy-6-oxonona-2,4-dienedioate hydrolase